MENILKTQAVAKPEVINMLKQKGISPTQQRVEIAQILFSKPQHLSADQVMGIVNNGEQRVSKATVYNTLGLFANKGLVREVIVDPTKIFYDSNIQSHHHFYNVDSGELTDIHAHTVQLNSYPELPEGTEADGVDIVVRLRNKKD
ncbi:MAG: transcriptional repressor [Gammaproteobacteria bacterium]|nr:transcriptional repressor [Gammaproteobacteria bacterium]